MDCEKNQVLWSVTKARWNGWGTWCRRLWHFGIYRSIEASVSLNMASWHRGILIYFFCQAQKYSIMSDGRSVRLALSVICVLIPALTSVFLDSARAYPSCQHRLVLRRIFTALFFTVLCTPVWHDNAAEVWDDFNNVQCIRTGDRLRRLYTLNSFHSGMNFYNLA